MKLVFVTTTIGHGGHYGNDFTNFGGWPDNDACHPVDIGMNKIVFVNQCSDRDTVIREYLNTIEGEKEIYIAAHESGGGVPEENGWHVAKFGHAPGGEVFDAIVALGETLSSPNKVDGKFDSLCRIIDLKPKMTEFAQFRHDIGKYFLPLDIDLQALAMIPKEEHAAYLAQIDKLAYNNDNFPAFEAKILGFMQNKPEISIDSLRRLCGIENGRIGEQAEIRLFLHEPGLIFSKAYPSFHDWFKALMNAIDELNPKK